MQMNSQNFNNNTGASISIWMKDIQIPSFSALDRNIDTDICIVGGGIAGLTCAYLLSQKGKSVTLLESGSIVGGQTARTTGHLTWILDDRFSDLEKLFGQDGSRMAAESHQAAVDLIEKIVSEQQIDCDFERVDSYLFEPPEKSQHVLNEELMAAIRAGIDVKFVNRAPFPSFDTGPCLYFPNQAQFHVLKYLAGLIKVNLNQGVKIFCHTHVKDCEDGEPCRVKTNQDYIVQANDVIIATNTPINDRFFIHTKQAPYRTYVIAARIPKKSIPKGLYWDTLDPYHYIRVQDNPLDTQNDWLIIGGEDHKTGQNNHFLEKYDILEEWARSRFPNMGTIDHKWSGQVMEPVDSLAFIGQNPHDQHVYIATGDSGNGLTHGTIAGILLTDLITHSNNAWTNLYHPSRKTLSALKEYTKDNLNVAAQYSEWMMPGEVSSVDQIARGMGAIMQKGLSKEAIYRDEEGHLHCYSAVCPHLGCIVKWNAGEKTWDCPCHGSQFNTDGQVINGPAVSDLTPCKE